MSELKIAVSRHCPDCFSTHRNIVNVDESRFIDVAAIVLSIDDIEHGKLDEIDATGYGIPVFVATHDEGRVPPEYLPRISGVFEYNESRTAFYGRQLETAASHYETQLRPPFFRALVDYVNQGNSAFDCPGHQGGEFFRRHPAGNQFVEYFGETLFRSDLCNADVAMGDLLIHEGAPQRAREARPFRLAVIQLGTYDGTIYNARQVVDKIGHLCDYILFDSAWVGYEQFIPMMADCSPLLLELNENDPGILVTQSVHKQQAGFSQTSQIHKKDSHIKGQSRYVPHKRMNNAFMMHASTSPFYPLFAALDVNAKMHEGVSGRNMWMDCVVNGIDARKLILENCHHIRPFVPELIDGKPWQSYPTSEIASDLRFFHFVPGEHWHAFEGYAEHQYFVDPCKLLLTTPGINAASGEYEDFGVPATILANFLRENGVVPEKCDLNSILFLLTPAEDMAKLQQLVALLARFEKLLEADAPLAEVLPSIYKQHEARYAGYTLRQLCQEMHDLYARHNVKQLQKEMFRKSHFPKVSMNPQEANYAYLRGEVELVRLPEAEGRIAAEGALPYPPGVLCVVPGEIWGGSVLRYFSALEEGINLLPGFAPELQGVYIEEHDGRKQVWCYVIKPRDAQRSLLKEEKL
ncbi:ornithine decarboxylase [Salmonella enterica subsp. enterica serovar Enteritidis]